MFLYSVAFVYRISLRRHRISKKYNRLEKIQKFCHLRIKKNQNHVLTVSSYCYKSPKSENVLLGQCRFAAPEITRLLLPCFILANVGSNQKWRIASIFRLKLLTPHFPDWQSSKAFRWPCGWWIIFNITAPFPTDKMLQVYYDCIATSMVNVQTSYVT